jgi:DNA topoisomerase-3
MKVVIAEKPSMARDIAAVVGATVKRDGYIEGGGYAVTWAFGHLVGLAMPEAYGFAGFRRENLPILPTDFKLVPRQIRDGKEWKPDPGVLKQLKTIRELFDRAEGVIVATDAGREGELIFRYIYHYLYGSAGNGKPIERLWISSLTDRAIRDGFKALRPGSEYDNLYLSAKARSEADWLIGINASQALSLTAGSGVWSLGRVQTPTLAMICSRFIENRDFTPQTYFRLKAHTAKDATAFAVLSADKYDDRSAADGVAEMVRLAGSLRVTSVECKEVRQEPPLLYDLTTLQKDANRRHGFSAEKTLSIAQSLYEAKKISYPRTGSRYISADVFEEVPHLVATLRSHQKFGKYIDGRMDTTLNHRSVDDAKVTDHHALLITEYPARGLSDDQQTIYDIVAGRMLEAFGEVCVKENTAVALEAGDVSFTARGSVTLIPGWRSVLGATADEETQDEDATTFPALVEGDTLLIRETEVQERKTKPKPLHTEASLLASMESAGKEVANEDEREAMKDAGIGTPATRAAIIETLFARDYIKRDKKSLVPTDKGLTVYMTVRDKKIADVAMTGSWELALSKIGTGEMNATTFHRSIEIYAKQITTELLDMLFERLDDRPTCPCPKCKIGTVTLYPKVAKCCNEACGLKVFRTVASKELTDAQTTALLTDGKTAIIKGFVSNKTGKTFEATVVLDAEGKTVFDFEKKGAKKGKPK